MNIFHKISLQGLRENRGRTIVTIMGVALSAAMITGTAAFGVSLLDYMTRGAMQKYGSWHVAFLDVEQSFVQVRMRDREVRKGTAYESIGWAETGKGDEEKAGKPYFFIAGFPDEAFDALPVTLLSGRLPEDSGEILVSGRAEEAGASYGLGDRISLSVGTRLNDERTRLGQKDSFQPGMERLEIQKERTYTVVGICQTPSFEPDSQPGYTLITRVGSEEMADGEARYNLFVTLEEPRRLSSYCEKAAKGRELLYNHHVLRFMGLSEDPADRIFNGLLYGTCGVVIAIIMVGSVFLIYNSFSISLNERTRQIGILASVGATEKQLRNAVLFEGLCIGAVGIPLGVLGGLGSMKMVLSAVAGNLTGIFYDGVPLVFKSSIPAITAAVVVSMVTILISAYLPAKKAAKTPVMECIRQTREVKLESSKVRTSRLVGRLFGLEGILAIKNFKRNQRRYRSVTLSLVLSIVLFMSTSSFVRNISQVSEMATVVTDYDIGLGTREMGDEELLELYETLRQADGITGGSYQTLAGYSCRVPAGELSMAYQETEGGDSGEETVNLPLTIQFLDDSTYEALITGLGLPKEEYTGQNGNLIAVAKMKDPQAQQMSQMPDLFTGAFVDGVLGPDQVIRIAPVEVVPPDIPPMNSLMEKQPFYFQAMAPWSRKDTLMDSGIPFETRVTGMTFQSERPARTMEEIKQVLQDREMVSSYILFSTTQALEENRNLIVVANVFSYIFIIMISLIAAANVFNTISTNIRLRRKELAMLRSVGMSERNFYKMMCFECGCYGTRALLFGMPLAVFCSWLIYRGMCIGGAEGIAFQLPWGSMGISILSVFLVVFATMMYAVGRLKKENIIEALRDDMV